MNGTENACAERAMFAHPLLLECDQCGRVLWMSTGARASLGEADHLTDVICGRNGAAGRAEKRDCPVCLRPVFGAGERVVLSAEKKRPPQRPEKTEALRNLEGNLLRHYFLLQSAERNLSILLQWRKPGGGGRRAARQIERERQRLGRELHTGVGQNLAAIRLQLEVIDTQLTKAPEPVAKALQHISTLASGALDQVRGISHRLHPPEWHRLNLESALEQLWAISGIPEKYDASVRIQPLPLEPDLDIKAFLYRAAQESLSNLVRHSKATRIGMSLGMRSSRIVLTIEDNGVGFDVARVLSAPPDVAAGIGLRSIAEQAESLGCKLTIESGAGGTQMEISAPFSAPE